MIWLLKINAYWISKLYLFFLFVNLYFLLRIKIYTTVPATYFSLYAYPYKDRISVFFICVPNLFVSLMHMENIRIRAHTGNYAYCNTRTHTHTHTWKIRCQALYILSNNEISLFKQSRFLTIVIKKFFK